MPKQDRFDGIRELIQKGKYDQARVLLKMMPDDPRAQQWLAKLNQMSPPAGGAAAPAHEPPPEPARRRDERARQGAKPRRGGMRTVWLVVRVFGIILLLCQCIWVIPLLNTLGVMPEAIAELEVPLPPVVEQSLDAVADSPAGRAVTDFTEQTFTEPIQQASENMQEEVFAMGFQQAAPMLESMCEQNTSTAQEAALCKSLMRDLTTCLEGGGTMDGCMSRVMTDVCRDYFGNDANAYNMCMQQMREIESLLP